MNSLHRLLLDLLQMAETPLYSAYCWLGDQLGRRPALSEFIELVRVLLDKELIRLWTIDPGSGERSQLLDLPAGLNERYVALGHADPRYDPLGLSIGPGPKADSSVEVDWEANLDFERGDFNLTATASAASKALHQLGRYFPDVDILPETTTHEGSNVRIAGRIRAHEAVTPGAEKVPS